MRVQTEEWRRFIPGVRMYKGKKTLFYNGEIIWDDENHEFLIYDYKETQSWEVIIVLHGVEVIPYFAFCGCVNVETVIMSDSVKRIEDKAFVECFSLEFILLSRNLEFIGDEVFYRCESLISIFIPPSCREIGGEAFDGCTKLIIFHVPQHTQLGLYVIRNTELMKVSPFGNVRNVGNGNPMEENDQEVIHWDAVNGWIKSHHADNEFSLHRACTSHNPLEEAIFNIVKREGVQAFNKLDRVGVTASQYLSENPHSEIKEENIIKRYILDMIGEVI